jgi:apolipoprotein N-acyltransferase
LDVHLDSHMVLQQLLFQLTRERRNKNWCQYISTGLEFLKSIQLTAFSWHQISKKFMVVYLHIIFQLMWNICDCFFSLCSLIYCLSSAYQDVLQLCVWAILLLIYFVHKSSKAFDSTKVFQLHH